MGCSMGYSIQKRFSQRFCIETMLTHKSSQGYCLEDVAILTHGKSSRRERPSCQLDFQQLEMAHSVVSHMFELHSPSKLRGSYNFHHIQASQLGLSAMLCQNVANGRLMSGSVRAADDKMAVMELRFFLQGLRQKPHRWGAAWGTQFRRDSVKDFASRPC